MTNNRLLGLPIACFVVLAFASTGYSAERKVWCHDEGFFEKLDDGRWKERTPGGNLYFIEKERTEKFIDLYDATRECYVRLFEKHCEVKFGNGKFTKLYDGTWRANLPDFGTRVDAIVAGAGIKANTPGVAVLVLEHGQEIFRKCYGLAHVKDKTPLTPQTTFELASCSKQFTGTAILLLFEQGNLALNDDVRKYLPELPEYDKKNPVRILHLARQTSGLREYMDFPDVKGKHKFEETWGAPPFRHETHLEVGDGAVWASLDDLARWDAGWRNGKILKAATIKLALVPSKYGDDQTTDYAFGWGVSVDKGKLLRMSHNGSWGGFLTYVDRNVAEDRTLIVLGNVDSLDVEAIVHTCRAIPPKGKE